MALTETLALRKAIEARDLESAVDCFAPDAVLHSPFTGRISFRGRDQIRLITSVLLEVAEDFRYTSEVRDGDVACLRASARVGGREIEFLDHIRFNEDGQIAEFTVFTRPLPATAAALRAFGAAFGRHKSAARGAVISALAAPLGFMAGAGDGVGVALIRPAFEVVAC
jgi:hypothetical protein